jgi:PAS domain S-box-containing protein
MIAPIVTLVSLSTGVLVLMLAILSSWKLIKVLQKNRFNKSWRLLLGLQVFFLVGYLIALGSIPLEDMDHLSSLLGVILLIGALFVFLVVKNGHRTIRDLYATSVSKQYVENIIQSMADTLIVVKLDPESRIKSANQATLNLLGYDEKELLDQPVSLILGEAFSQQAKQWLNNLSEDIREKEIAYKSKSDETIPMLYSLSPVHDLDGQVEGFILVGKDFRRIKEAQRALEESETRYRLQAEELSQSNTLKELLVDIITHDIKNPVGVIQGVSSMLIETEPENEFYGLVANSTERLLQVLNNATILSRVALHELIEKQPLDVSTLLQSVIDNFAPTFADAGMTIENQVKPGLIIDSNPVIEEIFTNYLSNAAKYAREGKRLIISQERVDGWLRLNFADFGTTIAADQREAVFKRSVQLEAGKKRGRGLGLAITTYIAHSLAACVGVLPNEPSGNIFYLDFPE